MKRISILVVLLISTLILKAQYDENGDYKIRGNVGIGNFSPKAKLDIYNSGTFNSDVTPVAQDHLLLSAPDPGNGNYFGGITWKSGGRRRASIVATRERDDTDYVGIAFFTKGTDGPGPMYESCLVLEYGYRLKIKLSCLIIHVLRRFIV
nr:hypothetical protein [uncultured Draconibacterium sp.]